MNDDTSPGSTPAGLYYVDRDARHAYLLNGAPLPPIEGVELAIMLEVVGTFGGGGSRWAYNALDHPEELAGRTPAGPITPQAGHSNLLGVPFGLYYVTSDKVMYALTGEGYLPLTRLDIALLRGYVQHAVDEIRHTRASR